MRVEPCVGPGAGRNQRLLKYVGLKDKDGLALPYRTPLRLDIGADCVTKDLVRPNSQKVGSEVLRDLHPQTIGGTNEPTLAVVVTVNGAAFVRLVLLTSGNDKALIYSFVDG